MTTSNAWGSYTVAAARAEEQEHRRHDRQTAGGFAQLTQEHRRRLRESMESDHEMAGEFRHAFALAERYAVQMCPWLLRASVGNRSARRPRARAHRRAARPAAGGDDGDDPPPALPPGWSYAAGGAP